METLETYQSETVQSELDQSVKSRDKALNSTLRKATQSYRMKTGTGGQASGVAQSSEGLQPAKQPSDPRARASHRSGKSLGESHSQFTLHQKQTFSAQQRMKEAQLAKESKLLHGLNKTRSKLQDSLILSPKGSALQHQATQKLLSKPQSTNLTSTHSPLKRRQPTVQQLKESPLESARQRKANEAAGKLQSQKSPESLTRYTQKAKGSQSSNPTPASKDLKELNQKRAGAAAVSKGGRLQQAKSPPRFTLPAKTAKPATKQSSSVNPSADRRQMGPAKPTSHPAKAPSQTSSNLSHKSTSSKGGGSSSMQDSFTAADQVLPQRSTRVGPSSKLSDLARKKNSQQRHKRQTSRPLASEDPLNMIDLVISDPSQQREANSSAYDSTHDTKRASTVVAQISSLFKGMRMQTERLANASAASSTG